MTAPYYADDMVTLYHGDCRELADLWTCADVLVTDPPYGRNWRQGNLKLSRSDAHPGIANDESTAARDAALDAWGDRPAIVFGDLMLPPPLGTKLVAIYWKNDLMSGSRGAIAGFRRDAEAIYLLHSWPSGLGGESSVIETKTMLSSANGIAKRYGHPHAKPGDVLQRLIAKCPPGVIADPFAGSGSTLVAAKALGRRAIGVELDERYCEIAARRLAQDVLDFGEAS